MTEKNPEDTLHWHALNFRTAAPQHAHEMWLALEAFVQRAIDAAIEADRSDRFEREDRTND